jgi:hypothetical protein
VSLTELRLVGVDWVNFGSDWGLLEGSFEHGNEPSYSVENEFLD